MATQRNERTGVMARIPKGYYTRQQVADLVGRSKDTIRKWHVNGIYRATKSQKIGGVYVFLYTAEDVIAIRKLAQSSQRVHKRKDAD